MKPKVYDGSNTWIFVSYSHKNDLLTFAFIEKMQQRGFRIWYDGGIEPGEEWLQTLAKRLPQCGCVIAMLTRQFPDSEWCQRELLMADKHKKPILPLCWEDVALPVELQFLLTGKNKENIAAFEGDLDDFCDYMASLKILAPYRDAAPSLTEEETEEEEAYVDPRTLPLSDAPADFLCSPDGKTLLGYRGPGGNVAILEGICSIEENAFRNKTAIRALRIPDGVTEIHRCAFSGCSRLEYLRLPESLEKLEDSAFSDCVRLQEVALPSRLTMLPRFTFHGCIALQEVIFPEKLKGIAADCFENCRSLRRIDLPATLQRLGNDAFADCSSLEAAAGPAHINPEAFEGTPLYKKLKG